MLAHANPLPPRADDPIQATKPCGTRGIPNRTSSESALALRVSPSGLQHLEAQRAGNPMACRRHTATLRIAVLLDLP